MIQLVLEIVVGFFKSLPIISKWFAPKTPTEKSKDKQTDLREDMNEAMKPGGRPKWD